MLKLTTIALVAQCCLLLFTPCGTSVFNEEDRKLIEAFLNLIELDYEDACEQRASALWDEMLLKPSSLERKLEREKVFGLFSNAQTLDIGITVSEHMMHLDSTLRRKIQFMMKPGDTLLDTEQWIRLVTFGENAVHKLRFATDYDCGNNRTCSYHELRKSMANEQDESTLKKMKMSWEIKLPNQTLFKENILPLLHNASKANSFNTVEEYWDFLGEYEGALLKARELWDQVKPLYVKLHKYVALRLKGPEAVGKPLPAYLLRSLFGEDWLNVIESLLPKKPDVYQKIHANLQLQNVGGEEAFKRADELLTTLNVGQLDSKFWSDSKFDGTCPTVIANFCKPNLIKVYTCKDVSIGNYLDAHETAMTVMHKELAAVHSNASYSLREANRYSALYEAMPGFLSLLALSPHALDRAGLYKLERYNYNQNHHRLLLQLMTALRDLPKLNYYLAVDEWRLKTLRSTIAHSEKPESWSKYREKFSLIESSDDDIVGDPYVLLNKPYIGKFLGIILKYNIYQSYAEELYSDEADLIDYISKHNERLVDAMIQGYSVAWPEMISDLLARREYGLESTGLTDYFKFLDEYLDNQLDPEQENEEFNYVEPPEEPVHENEIPTAESKPSKESKEKVGSPDDYLDNSIDTDDVVAQYKQGVETSTVAALEIKNAVPVPNAEGDKSTPVTEASYSTYWWIGIGVALAVVIILIAIIARKRHNHRKQLERQRRENSQA